jgi:hypothetical protein
MDRMLKIAAINFSGGIVLIIVDLLLGRSDFTFMLSLYFLLAIAIIDSLAIRPQSEKIKRKVNSCREDEILSNVRRAAVGERDARNYIINTLSSLSVNMTDEEKSILTEKNRFYRLKRQKGSYLKLLESILDRIPYERHH